MAPRKPDKGELLELRLARLLFAEGAFVRRSVDLRVEFGAEFTVTDIDVMAMTFLDDLAVRTLLAECKSGLSKNAPRAADRLLWGRGLRDLLEADGHAVVTAREVGPDARTLAKRLGSDVLDERDIARREAVLGLDNASSYGSHDPSLLMLQKEFYAAIKVHDELKRAWQFVHSEGWLTDPVTALKRALGACQLLSRKYGEDTTEQESAAIGWLFWQAALVFSVSVVRVAGVAYRQPEELFTSWFLGELAGGTVPVRELERMSRDVDEYVMNLLAQLGATPAQQIDALGFLAPKPPRYAEPLLELVKRFAAEPQAAAALPRVLDWRIAEAALGGSPSFGAADTLRLFRLVAAFLRGQGRVRPELLEPLAPRRVSDPEPEAEPHPEDPNGESGQAADNSAAQSFEVAAPTLFEPQIDKTDPPQLEVVAESINLEEASDEVEPGSPARLWVTVRNAGDEPQSITRGEISSSGSGSWALIEGQGEIKAGASRRLAFAVPTQRDAAQLADDFAITLASDAGPILETRTRYPRGG